MSFVENSGPSIEKTFLGTLQGVRPRPRGGYKNNRLLLALDELIFLPVKAFGQLPLVTAGARAEARSIAVECQTLGLRNWPAAFEGLRVAFLTDLHCSDTTPTAFLMQAVEETNRLKPDVVFLGGDYVTRGTEYIQPVADVLAHLRAPLGVYFVLGNHDHVAEPAMVRSALKHVGIIDVTNSGRWLSIGQERVRIAGIDDMWEGKPDLHAALSGTTEHDPVILLSHNPDFSMQLTDPRVRLVLSGHTHGGQILLPHIGAVVTNTSFGLISGTFPFDTFQLYVSRGLGTVVAPLRYQCPPEVTLLTLTNAK